MRIPYKTDIKIFAQQPVITEKYTLSQLNDFICYLAQRSAVNYKQLTKLSSFSKAPLAKQDIALDKIAAAVSETIAQDAVKKTFGYLINQIGLYQMLRIARDILQADLTRQDMLLDSIQNKINKVQANSTQRVLVEGQTPVDSTVML